MANYKVTDTELASIANAIRAKGGTSAQLEFPEEFVSAIEDISSSSGSIPSLVTADNYYFQDVNPLNAFGNHADNWWGSASAGTHYLSIKFYEPKEITQVKFHNTYIIPNYHWCSGRITFQGSNDGTTWTDLFDADNLTDDVDVEYTETIQNSNKYEYYRFVCYQKNGLLSGIGRIVYQCSESGGLSASVGKLFRHIMFSNSASDKVQRSDRWFQRNTNEPVLFLSAAYLQDGSFAYTGYAGISFSGNGITGTAASYGQLSGLTQKATPNGTPYYVEAMYGMFPPSTDSGKMHFMYASSNYEFLCVPSLENLLVDANTKDIIGDQNLIDLLNAFIDAMYQEYYAN